MKKFALSALLVVLLLVMLFPVARHMHASSSDDAAIRALAQQMIVAFNAKDIGKIMSLYVTGDDLVAFDVVPPRQYVGSDAYRKDWQEFLNLYSGTPTMEITVEYIAATILLTPRAAFFPQGAAFARHRTSKPPSPIFPAGSMRTPPFLASFSLDFAYNQPPSNPLPRVRRLFGAMVRRIAALPLPTGEGAAGKQAGRRKGGGEACWKSFGMRHFWVIPCPKKADRPLPGPPEPLGMERIEKEAPT
jgi:hypothetical protein